MLQFVQCSGAAPDNDEETRRTVRSQAMKAFRAQQRAEREAASSAGQGSGSTARALRRSKSTRRAGNKESTSSLTEEARSTPTRDSQSMSRQASSKRTRSRAKRNSNRTPAQTDSVEDDQQMLRRASSICSDGHHPTSNDGLDLNTTVFQPEDNDVPFLSAATLNRMSDFCKSYLKWLQPALDSQTAERVLSEVWEQSQSPILLAACYLAAAAHMDAVQPSEPIGDYAIYKAQILEEATLRMQSPDTATSNEVIGALACLQSFEMSQCSREATTHLQGLRSIIIMKGGLEVVGQHNLIEMVQTLDLLHAVVFDKRPIITIAENPLGPPSSDEDLLAYITVVFAAEQQSILGSPTWLISQLGALNGHLDQLVTVLRLSDPSLADQETVSSDNVDLRDLQQSLEHFARSEPSGDVPDMPNHLMRAAHCAFVILYNLIVQRAPYRCWNSYKAVERLFASVRCIEDEPRTSLPYYWLWIFITGASASQDISRIAYFQAQIVRTIYQMESREFRRVKEFLLNFIDLKKSLQRLERGVTGAEPIITSKSTSASSGLTTSASPQHRPTFGPPRPPTSQFDGSYNGSVRIGSTFNAYAEQGASRFLGQARWREKALHNNSELVAIDIP